MTLEKLTYKAGSCPGNICEGSLSSSAKGVSGNLQTSSFFVLLARHHSTALGGLVSPVLGTK